jgi:hypothetical protein
MVDASQGVLGLIGAPSTGLRADPVETFQAFHRQKAVQLATEQLDTGCKLLQCLQSEQASRHHDTYTDTSHDPGD